MVINNIIAINISLLLILLLLQLDNLYIKSSAQVEIQDEKNLDLNGIWKRIHDDAYEDRVHITQKGSEITATSKMGACLEDVPLLGYSWSGTLTGNTIQGKTMYICDSEQKRILYLYGLHFTISKDGKTLDGYVTDEIGRQYVQRYVFVSEFIDGVSTDPPPHTIPVVIGSSIAAVAAGGSGVFLYKHGYFKGIKHLGKTQVEIEKPETESEIKGELPIIEVKIECGLENPELIKREGSKFHKSMTGEITELEQKFSEGINKILESRKKLKSIQKDIEFIKWCKEAKEDPNKILSKISQDVIGKFLSSIEPCFQNLMLSQISIESDISVTDDRPKQIKKNITFSLIPIQAYIELVVYNNGLRVSSTKFVFTLNSYVKIKNLVVRFAKVNLSVDSNDRNNNMGKRIKIENLLFGINIELSKLKIGPIEKTIKPPLGIGRKEVEIKNILFFSGQTKEIS